ncbi:MAG: DegT/DnrJ/EryC1/StrS family aminotransferase [Terriglobia bacterium]
MIPFLDLQREFRSIQAELEPHVQRVLASGRYILGEEVAQFERQWAEYCGVSQALLVGSGTDGLTLALEASGAIQPGSGDEVITAAHGSPYTAQAIVRAGARPVFADIDPQTWLITPETIAPTLTPRTKAIVPVHLYGLCCDMPGIMRLAEERGLVVVEDACQAHGARFRQGQAWHRAGSVGNAAAFSFYPTKNLGCYGDAGALVSNDPELLERARLLAYGGQRIRNHAETVGYNSRGDELQAAILRCKLAYLDKWNARRRELAAMYRDLLRLPGLRCQDVPENFEHIYHLYVVRHAQRDPLRSYLRERGVETLIHYPEPIHRQPAFAGPDSPALPESERAAAEVLSLPLHPCLTQAEVEEVADAVNEFAAVRA